MQQYCILVIYLYPGKGVTLYAEEKQAGMDRIKRKTNPTTAGTACTSYGHTVRTEGLLSYLRDR
jgi:hypothetical protein